MDNGNWNFFLDNLENGFCIKKPKKKVDKFVLISFKIYFKVFQKKFGMKKNSKLAKFGSKKIKTKENLK